MKYLSLSERFSCFRKIYKKNIVQNLYLFFQMILTFDIRFYFQINLIRSDEEGKHPQSGEKHLKFANYHVDPIEFREQVRKVTIFLFFTSRVFYFLNTYIFQMVDHVRAHPKFINSRRAQKRKQEERMAEQNKKEL